MLSSKSDKEMHLDYPGGWRRWLYPEAVLHDKVKKCLLSEVAEMKILIVDNDTKLFDSIKCELKEARYEVDYAADGDEGLKFALEKQLDLIVLDWTLPKKDGLSVLKELREQKKLTPILMLTVEDSMKDIVRSLDSGTNSCVNKPFAIPVLIARMKALIRRSKWDNN